MKTTNGFIRLDRKLLQWEWYSDVNTKALFIHLLLIANFADTNFKGEIIKRGSVATTLKELSRQTNLTIRNTRTALNHLKSTNEVTIRTNRQYSIISINNYDKYQSPEKRSDKRVTNDRQTTGGESDTPKNKEDILNKEDIKNIFTAPAHARTRESINPKIHNFPERDYDFEKLKRGIQNKNKK